MKHNLQYLPAVHLLKRGHLWELRRNLGTQQPRMACTYGKDRKKAVRLAHMASMPRARSCFFNDQIKAIQHNMLVPLSMIANFSSAGLLSPVPKHIVKTLVKRPFT